MRIQRRLRGGAVVLVAIAIAACLGVPDLSSTSQMTIVVNQNPVFVGSAEVGAGVTSGPITLSPQGPVDDDTVMSITENCSNFSLNLPNGGSNIRLYCPGGSGTGSGTDIMTPMAVAGAGCTPVTYSFTAKFTPSGPGAASCAVRVDYAASGGSGNSLVIQLQGTGVAPMYALAVSPTTINFGDHPLGSTSSPTTVTLMNEGSTSLTVTGVNSNATNFPTSGPFSSQTIGPGSNGSFNVSCAPQAVGAVAGTLTLNSAAGAKTVTTSCNGIGMSSLAIMPVPVTFASTLVGRAPTDQVIDIRNDGTLGTTLSVSLTATNPDLTFAAGGNPDGQTLAVGAMTRVTLHYAATTPQDSGQIGAVTVNYSGGSPRQIPINAEALDGEIGTAPSVVEFGPVCANDTADQQVMVYASAPGNVQLTAVAPSGGPFSVTPMTGMLMGNHGNVLAQTVTVSPTAAGELEERLQITTNLPSSPVHELMLRATALPDGVTPTPAVLHFGAGQVHLTTSAREVALSNCGQTAIALTGARIEGVDAAAFTIVSPADPSTVTLGQRESSKFLVVMTPRTDGPKDATLVIEFAGGSISVPIDGLGAGGDDGTETDRETYYACSTGGAGTGAWPVVVAAVALRRRRRRRRPTAA